MQFKKPIMGSFKILNPTLSLLSPSRSDFRGNPDSQKVFLNPGSSTRSGRRSYGVRCAVQESDDEQRNGEERPESLFMKELKRRGLTPASLLEDAKKKSSSFVPDDEMNKVGEELPGKSATRNAVSTELEKMLSNQRQTSMQLNSEGLEGLVPRAKLLLTLGGTFFLAFWPLILITVSFFSVLYLYFGSSFIHTGTNMSVTPPPYVDPSALLEDERISQTAPRIKT